MEQQQGAYLVEQQDEMGEEQSIRGEITLAFQRAESLLIMVQGIDALRVVLPAQTERR